MNISGRRSLRNNDDNGIGTRFRRSKRLENNDKNEEVDPSGQNDQSRRDKENKERPIGWDDPSGQNDQSRRDKENKERPIGWDVPQGKDENNADENYDSEMSEDSNASTDQIEGSKSIPHTPNQSSTQAPPKEDIFTYVKRLIQNGIDTVSKKMSDSKQEMKWSKYITWKNFMYAIVVIIVVLMFSVVLISILDNEPESFEVNILNLTAKEIKLENSIDSLALEFPSQKDIVWYTFIPGIKSILRENPNKPSVFLLLYEGDSDTAFCLAKKVSVVGITYLTSKQGNPLIINGQEIGKNTRFAEDSGRVITAYNEILDQKAGMIVNELHTIPSKIARAFHFFCDRESPLVARSVLFFTLKNLYPQKKRQIAAEETLKNIWKELPDNELDPLITRLTGNVLNINAERQLNGCD